MSSSVLLAQIKLDQRAQPRAVLDTALTAEYSEAMVNGDTFPPLVVFHDGHSYWLADGFHRHYAAIGAGLRDFPCIVKDGGLRDAILYSCQANASHGWRRSQEDKRRAVQTLLSDEEWAKWSDREIARHAKVSQPFVSKLRPSVTDNVISEPRTYTTKHGTVSTMDTSRIGKPDRPVFDDTSAGQGVAAEDRDPRAEAVQSIRDDMSTAWVAGLLADLKTIMDKMPAPAAAADMIPSLLHHTIDAAGIRESSRWLNEFADAWQEQQETMDVAAE